MHVLSEELASSASSAQDLDHARREASFGDEVADEGGLCEQGDVRSARSRYRTQPTLRGDFSDDLMMIVLPAATAASLKTSLRRGCR